MPCRTELVCVLAGLLVGCGPELEVRRDLAYDDRFGASTTLDLYLPKQAENAPLVVLVHGGGWKEDTKDQLSSLGVRLAQEGFVAASLNYRLYPDGKFPQPVQDVACAVSWLLERAPELGARAERYGIFGYSAGGHLSSLLAVHGASSDFVPDCGLAVPPRPSAVISGAGPQDLRELGWASEVQNFLGGTALTVPELYAAASPVDHVDPDEPPFLFVHGELDVVVPLLHSERMHARLKEQGNRSELLVLHGGGHVFNPGPGSGQQGWKELASESPEAWSAILAFLKRELTP